ncbi:myeloid-derived growth factor [Leptodactylus fuscus]|uniref:myeloid-derived growth factor n=1 Tax=Leptodactylus fuscus TaxID=238119 RepID=UPI003F4E7A47
MAAAVVLSAALFFCLSNQIRAEDTSNTEEFDVKPGGMQNTYTKSMGDFSCSFSYAAQGGTNEKWLMSIGVDKKKRYGSCMIWRPSGKSYLYFLNVNVKVSGGKIEFCDVYSQADKPLEKTEYEVKDNTVSDNPGSFKSSVSKITIEASLNHEDL